MSQSCWRADIIGSIRQHRGVCIFWMEKRKFRWVENARKGNLPGSENSVWDWKDNAHFTACEYIRKYSAKRIFRNNDDVWLKTAWNTTTTYPHTYWKMVEEVLLADKTFQAFLVTDPSASLSMLGEIIEAISDQVFHAIFRIDPRLYKNGGRTVNHATRSLRTTKRLFMLFL